MHIGVTGGSGVIGTVVCDELIRHGHAVTSLDIAPPRADVGHVAVDLTRLEPACDCLGGFDQIVHLAAIPNPYADPAERVMSVNMAVNFCVFEAARRHGVSRVIYGCSESSTGFGIHETALVPDHVPIDEQHPCWPHETYSLSKHFGERIGANYARAFGLEVISLRYAWVWDGRGADAIAAIARNHRAGVVDQSPWFGAYIAVEDVARACAASVTFSLEKGRDAEPFEAFMLTARDTFYAMPTLDLLERILGRRPVVRDPALFEENPCASVFDIRKAGRMLGWTPTLGLFDCEHRYQKPER